MVLLVEKKENQVIVGSKPHQTIEVLTPIAYSMLPFDRFTSIATTTRRTPRCLSTPGTRGGDVEVLHPHHPVQMRPKVGILKGLQPQERSGGAGAGGTSRGAGTTCSASCRRKRWRNGEQKNGLGLLASWGVFG